MKRIIALLLVLVMSVSLFAGCQKEPEAVVADPTTGNETPATPETPDEPEVSDDPFDGTHEIVEVTWCINGDPQAEDEAVLAEVNKLLEERYNLHLNLEAIPGGEYDDKMRLKITSEEVWDLCFTANWSNNFYTNADMGAFLALNDLLEGEVGKELMAVYPEGLYNVATVNGNIYALPNYQMIYNQSGLFIQKDLMDKYGLNIENGSTINDVNDPEIKAFMEAVRDGEDDMFVIAETGTYTSAVAYGTSASTFGVVANVNFDDNDYKVYMKQEDAAFINHRKALNELYKQGFFREDVATVVDNSADMKANRYAMYITSGKPGGDVEYSVKQGEEYAMLYLNDGPYLASTAGIPTMTAINYNSANPEAALKLYTVMWTDPEIFNMLLFGIEGEHYTKVAENRVELIPESGYDRSSFGWMLGNQFNAWLLPGQDDGVWEETEKINRSATVCNMAGFVLNSEPIANEIAQINAVVAEYDKMFLYTDDVDAWAQEYVAKLKAAGAQTVMDEVQKQIDEWRVANGK